MLTLRPRWIKNVEEELGLRRGPGEWLCPEKEDEAGWDFFYLAAKFMKRLYGVKQQALPCANWREQDEVPVLKEVTVE